MWEEAAKKDAERHLNNVAHKESLAKEAKMRGLEDATKDLKHAMNKAVSQYNNALVSISFSFRLFGQFGISKLNICHVSGRQPGRW